MSSKTKTGLSESIPNKTSTATPRGNKLSRSSSKTESNTNASPLQATRLSYDRSPNSTNSKHSTDRKSPKPSPPSDKPPIRVAKSSDLQAQLTQAQDDLKKANEQIALLEKEKQNVCEELTNAQALAKEANEKLEEAVKTQKDSEIENLRAVEVEKLRAVEIEERGIEAIRRIEEELKNEIEEIKNKHSLDLSSLDSAAEDLQKIKQELSVAIDEKNAALNHADAQTEKAEQLSTELATHKAILDNISQTDDAEANAMAIKLKDFEEKLAESEGVIEQLNADLEAAKMSESNARKSEEQWREKYEELEMEIEKSGRLEKSASESLGSVMRQLEESNDYLQEAEDQISSLKEKLGLLEMTISRQKIDLENSEKRWSSCKAENTSIGKELEGMKMEMEALKEERSQALENEKLAASSVQVLLEEKNKLINEIECARMEEEKSKKAMETLASALHEVSAESREAKEMLVSHQVEKESNESQIEDLKLVLRTTNEKYESMLDESKNEYDAALKTLEELKAKHEQVSESLRKSEENKGFLEGELERVVREMKNEMGCIEQALEEFKNENLRLKEEHLDKETQMQHMLQENEDARLREAAALDKVDALSKLLNSADSMSHHNGVLSDKQHAAPEKVTAEAADMAEGEGSDSGKVAEGEGSESGKAAAEAADAADVAEGEGLESGKAAAEAADAAEGEGSESEEYAVLAKAEEMGEENGYKMWESCRIEEEEGEAKEQINGSENAEDGTVSPTKLKKKKSLYKKFGSLLKKKPPL